ncbi:MAG: DUF2357 domain-containing protein, partial [Oligoflexia bacterium]|nr:DUF2357 domain-containing protein [Oligoflexia bacterium]
RMRDRLEDLPLHRTRAADRETVAWLARRPREAGWLDPVRSLELSGPPPAVCQRVTRDTLDHPANRYVNWLIDRLVRRLAQTATALEAHTGSELNDTRSWVLARAAALRVWSDRLDRLRRRSFLRDLPKRPASEGAMLVVLDHPLYSRVHRLARRVLSARFALDSGPQAAATRPSFELYELWCFLAVQRVLNDHLGTGFRWSHRGMDRLLCLDGTGGGAAFCATDGSRHLELLFNPTFASVLRPTPSHGRISLSSERRPDLVLSWTGPGVRRFVIFDAKYRAGAANLGDAMQSAHIYRDALRWPDRGGRCEGAWLLAPRRSEDADLWFQPAFHQDHGFGVLELRPGRIVGPVARARLCAVLQA